MSSRPELFISCGAVVGVLARFAIGSLVQQVLPIPFPVGTLLINVAGCFLIGVVQTLFLDFALIRRNTQLLLSVGLCGGLTTFSAFSLETLQLLQTGHVAVALWYQASTLVGGVAAVIGGAAMVHAARKWWTSRGGHTR